MTQDDLKQYLSLSLEIYCSFWTVRGSFSYVQFLELVILLSLNLGSSGFPLLPSRGIPDLLCFLSCRAATDHNVDNTTEILREWLKNVQRLYHYVEWRPMDEPEWVARGHSVNALRALPPLSSFPAIRASSLGGACDLSLFFICISSKFLPLADLYLPPFLFTPAGSSSHEFTSKSPWRSVF